MLATELEACEGNIEAALARYSQQRVPEGHALLDLSIGPSRDAGPIRRVIAAAMALKDAVLFRIGLGEPPLQTQLTTSLTPFAELRRSRDASFGAFPAAEEFDAQIARVAGQAR